MGYISETDYRYSPTMIYCIKEAIEQESDIIQIEIKGIVVGTITDSEAVADYKADFKWAKEHVGGDYKKMAKFLNGELDR